MTEPRATAPIAAVIGMVLWFVVSLASGRREAWDTGAYWFFAYPTALIACAALGYQFPQRPWRWAVALFAGQFVAMVLRNDEVGSLWPLGLAMFGVLSLPGVVAARWGARFRN